MGGIVGGRILYVISYWREQFAPGPISEIFMVQHGGLVPFMAGSSALYFWMFYMWLKKLPVWKMARYFISSVALGYVFGRMGCLLNGCCVLDANATPLGHPLRQATKPTTFLFIQRKSTIRFLNFCFYYLFLAWLFRRKKFDGQIFAVYLIGYAIIRSFVEIFRGDYPVHYLGGIATPAQLVSIGIIAFGLALLALLPHAGRGMQPETQVKMLRGNEATKNLLNL